MPTGVGAEGFFVPTTIDGCFDFYNSHTVGWQLFLLFFE